jgi:hypothetical protein
MDTNRQEFSPRALVFISVNWWLGLAPAAATRAKVPLEPILSLKGASDYRNWKTANPSFPKIDRSETGVSRLQNGQE